MSDENSKPKKSSHAAPILALSTVLAAAPTLGFGQALTAHGQDLTDDERALLGSLSPAEVEALSSINTQLETTVKLADTNNNVKNNNVKSTLTRTA